MFLLLKRVLKELNITNKKINNYIVCKEVDKIIAERIEYSKKNAEKIKNSLDDVNIDNFNKSICIDESSFLVSDITRYGYSKKGTSINKLIKHKKNKERYNLLMAISTDGVVGYEISAKPFNTDKYILVRKAYHAWYRVYRKI